MERAELRIEVFYTISDARGEAVRKKLTRLGFGVTRVVISDNYLINEPFTPEERGAIGAILIQPVTQSFSVNDPFDPGDFDFAIEVGFLPGVTD
ncbi:MAG TPA: hypothetical protein PKY31_03580, partial [Spirochaetota bacterium]|nr:hypothetical protein [Spirochaetota bacterium]